MKGEGKGRGGEERRGEGGEERRGEERRGEERRGEERREKEGRSKPVNRRYQLKSSSSTGELFQRVKRNIKKVENK